MHLGNTADLGEAVCVCLQSTGLADIHQSGELHLSGPTHLTPDVLPVLPGHSSRQWGPGPQHRTHWLGCHQKSCLSLQPSARLQTTPQSVHCIHRSAT